MPAPKKESVKRTGSLEASQLQRQQSAISIRKEKRLQGLQKKRNIEAPTNEDVSTSIATPSVQFANPTLALLEDYVAAVRSDVHATRYAGVCAIRRLLSKEQSPPVQPVLSSGIVPALVALVGDADSAMAFEAAWAVTNIASTDQTKAIVDLGAIAPLIAGTMSSSGDLREQCMWGLGNIAGDCPKFRNAVLASPNALQAVLLNIQQPHSVGLLRTATWLLANLCRGKPAPTPAAILAGVPALAYLTTVDDASVMEDALWGLCYLTDTEQMLQLVMDSGVLPRIVALMQHADARIVNPALRIVGNVIAGNDSQTQAAIDAGALRAIVPLLNNPNRSIKREACWAISNAAAGTPQQITQVMTVPGLVTAIIQQLRTGEWNIRKEAAWVVSNIATMGTAEHARQLVASGVVEPLVDVLHTEDARMLCVVLDAIAAMLRHSRGSAAIASCSSFVTLFEEAGLTTVLEEKQEHDNEDVYSKCVALIEAYYAADEDETGGVEAAPFIDMSRVGNGAENWPPANSSKAQTNNFAFSATNTFPLGTNVTANGRTVTTPSNAAAMSFGSGIEGVAPTQLFASPPTAGRAPELTNGFSFANVTFA